MMSPKNWSGTLHDVPKKSTGAGRYQTSHRTQLEQDVTKRFQRTHLEPDVTTGLIELNWSKTLPQIS